MVIRRDRLVQMKYAAIYAIILEIIVFIPSVVPACRDFIGVVYLTLKYIFQAHFYQ